MPKSLGPSLSIEQKHGHHRAMVRHGLCETDAGSPIACASYKNCRHHLWTQPQSWVTVSNIRFLPRSRTLQTVFTFLRLIAEVIIAYETMYEVLRYYFLPLFGRNTRYEANILYNRKSDSNNTHVVERKLFSPRYERRAGRAGTTWAQLSLVHYVSTSCECWICFS